MKTGPVRVLVAEDSVTMRTLLKRALEPEPRIELLGFAENGVQAVDQAVRLRPDVITMDIQMPGLDGLGATAAIMAQAPTRVLIVADSSQAQQTQHSFKAVEVGALELIPKLSSGSGNGFARWAEKLVRTILLTAEIPVITRRRVGSPLPSPVPFPSAQPQVSPVTVVGIVASTGGPTALREVLSALGQDLPVPILIAQHMSPGFVAGFAQWLSGVTGMSIDIAKDGAPCVPGTAYLAPGGWDLRLSEPRKLSVRPSEGMITPNGDALLTSLAEVCGPRAAGAVLTGMGTDGAQGLKALRRAGGLTVAQEASSCVVYGMPRAAAENGAACHVLSLGALSTLFKTAARISLEW